MMNAQAIVLFVVLSGCSCQSSMSVDVGPRHLDAEDGRDSEVDALVTDDGFARDGVSDLDPSWFERMDLDSMTCQPLELAWYGAGPDSGEWYECATDEDCLLVSTGVDCKGVLGSDVSIQGCLLAHSIARIHEEEWLSYLERKTELFCAARTVPISCGETSLCPAMFEAKCESHVCQARSVPVTL